MKLYHGSPKKLKTIKPTQAKGLTKFENQKAIFLCKNFNHAALYAISKSLKGRVVFAVTPQKLIIVGDGKIRDGYVYEVNIIAKKGERGQFSFNHDIKDFTVKKVFSKDYLDKVVHVKDFNELKKMIKI